MTKNNLYSHLKKSVPQFCTISTASHLFKSYALADSLAPYGIQLYVLVVDTFSQQRAPDNVRLLPLSDKLELLNYTTVYQKYKNYSDKLRWALKPVFILDLLDHHEQVVYIDNDCFFFGEPSELTALLNKHAVLLTPHHYPSNPQREQNWLEANYRVGLYNAGFIAVNKQAQSALTWWMQCCLYSLKKAYWRGLFDDQKYLDLLPIKFDRVHLFKNRGYNLAGWNDMDIHLQQTPSGWNVNHDSLVFVHFAALTLEKWSHPAHPAHQLYVNYLSALRKHQPSVNPSRGNQLAYRLSAYGYYLRWKLVRIFE